MKNWISLLFALVLGATHAHARFQLLFLADHASPLTGVLCAADGSHGFVAIDPGATYTEYLREGETVEAHLLSDSHLHRLSGLIMQAMDAKRQNLYATAAAIETIRDHVFNWKVWPNFADEGLLPHLDAFHYVRMPLSRSLPVPRTALNIEAIQLPHPSGATTVALLVESQGDYLVYLGDVALSRENALDPLWERLTPLVNQHKVRAIVLDSPALSLAKGGALFGGNEAHTWMKELQQLARRVNQDALKGVPLVVTHVQGCTMTTVVGTHSPTLELEKQNQLGLQLLFPKRGDRLDL